MNESVEASAIPVQQNEEVVGDCHDNKDKQNFWKSCNTHNHT